LEDIQAERDAGKNKHLIIAATGTGKTMVAGFDYKNFAKQKNKQPTLLFIAHREEILKQARTAFRQILKDGSFGDIVVGGNQITQTWLHSVLWNENRPGDGALEQTHQFIASRKGIQKDLIELFDWLLGQRTPLPNLRLDISGPLTLHASYTRKQILMAFGQGNFAAPRSSREGLLHIPDQKIDLFFADINKTEADYSPTTMYEDYAINESLFHWQSQSTASEDSATGQRYIHHKKHGLPRQCVRRKRRVCNSQLFLRTAPLDMSAHPALVPIPAHSALLLVFSCPHLPGYSSYFQQTIGLIFSFVHGR
jgi:hypothetical protein